MRKSAVVILLAIFCHLNSFGQEAWVELTGKLAGFNNQVLVENMSEFQYLLPAAQDRLIVPDTAGNFKIRFNVSSPNYFRLGRNALYLSPGDKLNVFIDYRNPRLATFEGQGAAANTYLKGTPFPKGGSYIEAGSNIKSSPEATLAFVEEMSVKRAKELAAVSNVSAEFKRLETARIKADLINSILSGESYSIYKLKLKDEAAKSFSEAYKNSTAKALALYSKDFMDASLLKLVVYRDIADGLLKYGGAANDMEQIRAYYAASELVRDMQQQSDKKILVNFKPQIGKISTSAYRDAVNKQLETLMAFGKGDIAHDFTAVDNTGKKISLSSLKGKVIYVDLWATWCGPCLQEMPHFEKLKEQYASNKEVVFVSLSIDDNLDLWQKSLQQRKAGGYQWLINRNKLQAYHIVGIPRSLLIDKNFKIVDMAAPLPSATAATKAIDALLQ